MSCPTDINKGSEDINMDLSRGRSPRSSVNSSREGSVISKLSNDIYSHRMEIQSKDPNWANQIDNEIFHVPTSSQVEGESNTQAQAALNLSIPTTCVDLNTTTEPKQAINSLSPPVLLYKELQLANINSWDGHTHPISLFGRLGT